MISYYLTGRQRDILSFLRKHHRITGMVPSVREIQKQFGFSSSNTVAGHLRALERKGCIQREAGKARAIAFLHPEQDAEMPEAIAESRIAEPIEQIRLWETAATLSRNLPPLPTPIFLDAGTRLFQGDALEIMRGLPPASVTAIVTDPPYGLVEYEQHDHEKLRLGRGGVWRIPPKLDGIERSPLPRFTVLGPRERERLVGFFREFAGLCEQVLVPGGHLFLASNPLLSSAVFQAVAESGLEKRGEIIRLVTTLRGGDRPKGAETEFPEVSVMPRSGWEPWGLFRKALAERTVSENLRVWGAGALRRPARDEPFKDVVVCGPARGREREFAPHPSLKPQRLMRQLVRASLPLGRGVVLDPFAGSGSTLAAASALGYDAIGIERDAEYFALAQKAFAGLKTLALEP